MPLIPISPVLFAPFGFWMLSLEIYSHFYANSGQFSSQMAHSKLLAQDAQQRLAYLFSG